MTHYKMVTQSSRNLFSYSSGGYKSEIKDHDPSETLDGLFPCLFLASGSVSPWSSRFIGTLVQSLPPS